MGKTSIYFPTWASPWVSKSSDMDLAKLPQTLPGVGIVYLSFADPTCNYVKQQRNFNGTGLQFSHQTSCSVRHGLKVVYAIAVEINDGEAQVIVTPDEFAISDVERSELLWL